MFNKVCLFSIGRLTGAPLTLDIATAEFKRPSMDKICIQVDLLKDLPKRVWLKCGGNSSGFWQEIVYDKVPQYCKHCQRLGYDISSCLLTQRSNANVHAQH